MKIKLLCMSLLLLVVTNTFAAVGTPYSGSIPRVLLFAHGNSDAMSFWQVTNSGNTVTGYKANGIPKYVAGQYGITNMSQTALNENGIEFFNGAGTEYTTEQYAALLKTKIIEVLNKYKNLGYASYTGWESRADVKIDIICHSQAGVAIRKMILDNPERSLSNPVNHINSIITLNSPHLGTSIVSVNPVYESAKVMQDLVTGTKEIQIRGSSLFGEVSTPLGDVFGWTFSVDNRNQKLFDEYRGQISTNSALSYDFDISEVGDGIAADLYAMRGQFGFENPLYDELNAAGFPKRPYDNSEIPFTAFYSRVGEGHLNNIVESVFTQLVSEIDSKADDVGLGEEVHEIAREMKNSVQSVLDLIDSEWMANSDGVVDVFSQKLEGLFDPVNSKFQTIELTSDIGVAHGTSLGLDVLEDYGVVLDGPEFHGAEVFAALANPPYKKYQHALDVAEDTYLNVNEYRCGPAAIVGSENGTALKCISNSFSTSTISFTLKGVNEMRFDWREYAYTFPVTEGDIELWINGVYHSKAGLYKKEVTVELNSGVDEIEFRFNSSSILDITNGYIDNIRLTYNIVPTIITPLLLN